MTTLSLPHLGGTLLRLTAGIALITHSLYLKVFVFTMSGTVAFFESIGLPGLLAWVTLLVEIVTGAMLTFKIKPHLAATAAVPVLLGAIWAHSSNGWLFSNAGGGWEYPLFWTMTLLSIALTEWQSTKVVASSDVETCALPKH
ncbi:DoxX family protein [Pseudomonas vlassakiae]|uniref:DoxX family protein n=1 Tax=Pseudomonas vlassakiae TaxID=485888 RepID=UPI0021C59315|nr:DoxX family protein [Pseudomonas vlassakiae]MCU0127268.1 DoxX family protein [Pseudomonas vlassakiae]